MRRTADRLTDIIEPIVAGMGYECVGVEFVSQGKHSVLRVFIDSDDGVQLDDCARVSHQVSGALDVEDPISGNYQLEISSPGIDRPLFKLEDFYRFKGQAVEVQLQQALEESRKLRGLISDVRGPTIILEIDGGIREVPFDLIRKACLAPEVFGGKQGQRNGK